MGKFQSTPSHGGRLHRQFLGLLLYGFNPRPRTEGDYYGTTSTDASTRFNPRPRTEGDARQPLQI